MNNEKAIILHKIQDQNVVTYQLYIYIYIYTKKAGNRGYPRETNTEHSMQIK